MRRLGLWSSASAQGKCRGFQVCEEAGACFRMIAPGPDFSSVTHRGWHGCPANRANAPAIPSPCHRPPFCSQLRPVEKTLRKGRGEGLAGAALDRREHLVDVVLVPSLGGRWRRMRGLPKAGRSLTELVSAGLSRAALDLPKPRERPGPPRARRRPRAARDPTWPATSPRRARDLRPAARPRPVCDPTRPRGPTRQRCLGERTARDCDPRAVPARRPCVFPVANQLRISCELVAIYVFSSCELFSE